MQVRGAPRDLYPGDPLCAPATSVVSEAHIQLINSLHRNDQWREVVNHRLLDRLKTIRQVLGHLHKDCASVRSDSRSSNTSLEGTVEEDVRSKLEKMNLGDQKEDRGKEGDDVGKDVQKESSTDVRTSEVDQEQSGESQVQSDQKSESDVSRSEGGTDSTVKKEERTEDGAPKNVESGGPYGSEKIDGKKDGVEKDRDEDEKKEEGTSDGKNDGTKSSGQTETKAAEMQSKYVFKCSSKLLWKVVT